MSTMTFSNAGEFSYFSNVRAPRISFAARLAVLQAKQEQSPHLSSVFGAASRLALAVIPAGALAYLFVAF